MGTKSANAGCSILRFALLAALAAVWLAGCVDEDASSMNVFYSRDSRQLAERIEVTADGISIELEPPLEVKQRVQYVTLAVPSANLWDRGADAGTLLMPDGRPIRLIVDLETVSGKRFELRSVSFGKELMFSHMASGTAAQASDLPATERFNRLHLKSSVPLVVDEVRWVDVTNK